MLEALELHEHSTEADCHISQYAISGASNTKAIHLRALIGNQVLSILVDSGSSNTFLNSAMMGRIPYKALSTPSLTVKVANGQTLVSTTMVQGLEWWLQGHTFYSDARVLDIGAYDLILGMDWLEQHSPMQCDWLKKKLTFMHQGTTKQDI
jgi:hypothetical protein